MITTQAWPIDSDQFNRDVATMLDRLQVRNWPVRGELLASVPILAVALIGFFATRSFLTEEDAPAASEVTTAAQGGAYSL